MQCAQKCVDFGANCMGMEVHTPSTTCYIWTKPTAAAMAAAGCRWVSHPHCSGYTKKQCPKFKWNAGEVPTGAGGAAADRCHGRCDLEPWYVSKHCVVPEWRMDLILSTIVRVLAPGKTIRCTIRACMHIGQSDRRGHTVHISCAIPDIAARG